MFSVVCQRNSVPRGNLEKLRLILFHFDMVINDPIKCVIVGYNMLSFPEFF